MVTRKSADLGATLPKHLATGEVVSVGAGDLAYIGNLMEVSARFAGSIVAFVVVAVDPALVVDHCSAWSC